MRTIPVARETICPELGSFGTCDQGICDLSQDVKSGVIQLTVSFGDPEQRPFYEVMCEGAVPFSGSFEPINETWQQFIAMPVGPCTLSTFLLDSDGEKARQADSMLVVTPGFLGEISERTTCQL